MDAPDLAIWQGCKTGPNVPLDAAAPDFDDCVAADLDADNDVDLGDFALMQPYLISGFAAPAATTYAYNYRNQLVEAVLPTGQRHEYRYDVLGRRIGRILDAGGTPQRTAYFYDGSRVIEERSGATTVEATYVFGLYVDEVLSMRRAIGGSTPDFYFFTDDQYSVTAVTAPDGDVLERYTYDDFGALTILDPASQPRTASAIGNPYTYTGRRYDAEIGLYYYRTRHLDPTTGRFTTRDSIGLWGDPLNLGNGYTYVGNNPWTFVDPTGLGVYPEDVPGANGTVIRHYYRKEWFGTDQYVGTFRFDPYDFEAAQIADDWRRVQNFLAAANDVSGVARVGLETAARLHPITDLYETATARDGITGETLGAGQWTLSAMGPFSGLFGILGDASKVGRALDDAHDVSRVAECKIRPRGGVSGSVGEGIGKIVNRTGKAYPNVTDLRTGKAIPFPEGNLTKVPQARRAAWGLQERGQFIAEWYRRSLPEPPGGWSEYDIHHIRPREYGGTNDFDNLVPVKRGTHQDEFNGFWRDY